MLHISDKLYTEKKHTFYVTNFFLWKSSSLWDNVDYCRAEQATDENKVHVHCMLDT